MNNMNALQRAIDHLGSQSALAAALGVVPQVVHNWRMRGSVPAERCPAIERATDGAVRCEELRPDVDWAYLRNTQASAVAYNCVCTPVATHGAQPEPDDEPPCGLCDPRQGERRTHPDRRQARHNHEEAA